MFTKLSPASVIYDIFVCFLLIVSLLFQGFEFQQFDGTNSKCFVQYEFSWKLVSYKQKNIPFNSWKSHVMSVLWWTFMTYSFHLIIFSSSMLLKCPGFSEIIICQVKYPAKRVIHFRLCKSSCHASLFIASVCLICLIFVSIFVCISHYGNW